MKNSTSHFSQYLPPFIKNSGWRPSGPGTFSAFTCFRAATISSIGKGREYSVLSLLLPYRFLNLCLIRVVWAIFREALDVLTVWAATLLWNMCVSARVRLLPLCSFSSNDQAFLLDCFKSISSTVLIHLSRWETSKLSNRLSAISRSPLARNSWYCFSHSSFHPVINCSRYHLGIAIFAALVTARISGSIEL